MAPVQIFAGSRPLHPPGAPPRAPRRRAARAAAVRDHEAKVRRPDYEVRPQDQALYRRVRQICGDG